MAEEILDTAALKELARTCTCIHVRRAARVMTQFYDSFLPPDGLRMTQFAILVAIGIADQQTVKQLAESMAMDRSAFARSLKPMEDQGLLTVEPGTDRRTRVVRLTDAGRRTMMDMLPAWQEAQTQASARLGEEQARSLLLDLKKVEKLTI